jgi:hypothetical protein
MANRVSTTSRRSVLMGAAVVPAVLASAPVAAAGGDPSIAAYAAFRRIEDQINAGPELPDDDPLFEASTAAEQAWMLTPATTARGFALKLLRHAESDWGVSYERGGPRVVTLGGFALTDAEVAGLLRDACRFAGEPAPVVREHEPRPAPKPVPAPPAEPPFTDEDRAEMDAAWERSFAAISDWHKTRRRVEVRAWSRVVPA